MIKFSLIILVNGIKGMFTVDFDIEFLSLVLLYTQATRTKSNIFDPVLSANAYVGHAREDEGVVQVEPRLEATDDDPSNSPNGLFVFLFFSREYFCFSSGQICGYELSLHKHDDSTVEIEEQIPFLVELNNGQGVIKLKPILDKLDCETKQTYSLFIRAYDCADVEQRRYSERY